MAKVQVTDLFLNNQTRVTEAAVVSIPAKLSDGDFRLGTGPQFITASDTYEAYSIPAFSIVDKFSLVVREPFDAGITATVKTIVDGEVLLTNAALDTAGNTVSAIEDALFTSVDGFSVTFSDTSSKGVLQLVADYTSLDDKSGKYTAPIN